VHRSKGLEFPVVICPTLWAGLTGRRSRHLAPHRWHPIGQGAPRLALSLDPRWGEGRKAAEEDRQAREAERERLAYVAMTRAQHLLVLGWSPVPPSQPVGPLTRLLFPEPAADGGPPTLAEWRTRLEQQRCRRGLLLRIWDGESDDGRVDDPAADAPSRQESSLNHPPLRLGPTPDRPLGQHWARSSYSSWLRRDEALTELDREEGRDVDESAGATITGGSAGGVQREWSRHGPLETFPRGADAGDCLHRILERVDYTRPVHHPATIAVVDDALRQATLPPDHRDALLQFLDLLFATPFGGALGQRRVGDLPIGTRLNELAFDLPLAISLGAREEPEALGPAVTSSAFARLFRRHPAGRFGARYADQLEDLGVSTRGFLTGSIDLVFTDGRSDHEPRWWLADWKSTWTGERDAEDCPSACGPAQYSPSRMEALMREHHYPLQAHLYLVALHRYLSWRLPGYDPQRHLGGYVVVFLRGVAGACPAPPSGVPGMMVDPVNLDRVLAIDALMRGEPEV